MAYNIPFFQNLQIKTKSVMLNLGGGINNGTPPLTMKDNQATDMRNVSNNNSPAISGRDKKSSFATTLTGTIYHFGKRETDNLTAVANDKWKYWNGSAWIDILTLTNQSLADSLDFRGKTLLVNGPEKKWWDGSTSGSFSVKPNGVDEKNINLIETHTNRLFGANTGEQYIYYSSLADYTDWISTTDVNSGGVIEAITSDNEPITGIKAYNNHLMVFKRYTMMELYGSDYNDFTLRTLSDKIGCVNNKSIAEANGILFFLSEDGVRAYAGGITPYNTISEPIQKFIDNIDKTKFIECSGYGFKDNYYLTLPQKDGTYITCVYSVKDKVWFVQDDLNSFEYQLFKDDLYTMTKDGKIYNLTDENSEETFEWYFITKPFNENAISEKKCYNKLYVVADVPSGNTLEIFVSNTIDDNDFKSVAIIKPDFDYINQKISIPSNLIPNSNWVRIKMLATQDVVVHAIEKQMRIRQLPF